MDGPLLRRLPCPSQERPTAVSCFVFVLCFLSSVASVDDVVEALTHEVLLGWAVVWLSSHFGVEEENGQTASLQRGRNGEGCCCWDVTSTERCTSKKHASTITITQTGERCR